MPEFRETVKVRDCTCTKETAAAILVTHEDWDEPIWFPKSQVDDDSEVFDDDENAEGTLVVSAWIAGQKGVD